MEREKILRELLSDLHDWQQFTRHQWVNDYVYFDVVYGFLMVNFRGETTVMPSYPTYNENWIRAGYDNPFEVEWLRCDVFSSIDYIELVRETLQEQRNMWGSFESTRACFSYAGFMTFMDRLERLYEYVVFSTEKQRLFISN